MELQEERESEAWARSLGSWLLALGGFTVGGAIWLDVTGGSHREVSAVVLLIAYTPTLAAIIALTVGGSGIHVLLDQLRRWKVPVRWYAVALVGPLVIALVATLSVAVVDSAPVATIPERWVEAPALATLAALLGPMIAGAVGEEPGWRGFAQPVLQRRASALVAAVVVGVIWSLWHLWPALTTLGRAELSAADVVQTFVRLVPTAVIGTDTGSWAVAVLYALCGLAASAALIRSA